MLINSLVFVDVWYGAIYFKLYEIHLFVLSNFSSLSIYLFIFVESSRLYVYLSQIVC